MVSCPTRRRGSRALFPSHSSFRASPSAHSSSDFAAARWLLRLGRFGIGLRHGGLDYRGLGWGRLRGFIHFLLRVQIAQQLVGIIGLFRGFGILLRLFGVDAGLVQIAGLRVGMRQPREKPGRLIPVNLWI